VSSIRILWIWQTESEAVQKDAFDFLMP